MKNVIDLEDPELWVSSLENAHTSDAKIVSYLYEKSILLVQ